jgi:hypothetical protein
MTGFERSELNELKPLVKKEESKGDASIALPLTDVPMARTISDSRISFILKSG